MTTSQAIGSFLGEPRGRHFVEGDTLEGEDVLPGFSCLVAELFPKEPRA